MTIKWTQIEGQWQMITWQVKSKWIKLSEEDVTTIAGKKVHLIHMIAKRYDVRKPEAERQVNDWVMRFVPMFDPNRPIIDPKLYAKHP